MQTIERSDVMVALLGAVRLAARADRLNTEQHNLMVEQAKDACLLWDLYLAQQSGVAAEEVK